MNPGGKDGQEDKEHFSHEQVNLWNVKSCGNVYENMKCRRRSGMDIIDLVSTHESAIKQVAQLLVEGFAINWPNAWLDILMAKSVVR
jgi:hypothetical protein